MIPEHSTAIGKMAAAVTESSAKLEEFFENHRYAVTTGSALPMVALKVLPLLLKPAAVIACDPFLFIELPDEPGKLRMIGHWYWQPQPNGEETLHVHV